MTKSAIPRRRSVLDRSSSRSFLVVLGATLRASSLKSYEARLARLGKVVTSTKRLMGENVSAKRGLEPIYTKSAYSEQARVLRIRSLFSWSVV